MKTTIDLADPVYRQVKVRAALKGETMRAFVVAAIRDKLAREARLDSETSGWRTVWGQAPAGSTAEVQAIIDQEFSQIDPEAWL